MSYTEQPDPNAMTTEQKLQAVWDVVKEKSTATFGGDNNGNDLKEWPGYDELLAYIQQADYEDTLRCPLDIRSDGHPAKSLCAYGVACTARIELFPCPPNTSPYTGLLRPGQTLEHCLVRLSSAIKPPNTELKSRVARTILYASGQKLRSAKIFPCAALKIFRNNAADSGNALFGGCKVGQQEENYFSHCLSTQMTETMPRAVKPFVRKFWKYSDHPLSLGVSDLCRQNVDGVSPSNQVRFPFCLILKPAVTQTFARHNANDESFDTFLDDMVTVPVGTHLFDLFACPYPTAVPDPSKLQRIGKIVSTSGMVKSPPNDGLFFKHQRKEEDYIFRPDWKQQLNTKCSTEDGRTGTVAKLAGWEVFENGIAKGAYVDFEKEGQ